MLSAEKMAVLSLPLFTHIFQAGLWGLPFHFGRPKYSYEPLYTCTEMAQGNNTPC